MFRGIINRNTWGAAPPTANSGPQYFDEGLILHWEGPEMWGDLWAFAHETCYEKVRGIQRYHQTHGYADIAYSDIICPHGYIFNCRSGIPMANGASGTSYINKHAPAICFLWGVNDDHVLENNSDPMDALNAVRNYGIAFSGMSWTVRGHRDIVSTSCPGDTLQWIAGSLNGQPPQDYGEAAPVPPAPSEPVLKKGDSGPIVADWQNWLNVHTNAGLALDGDFGPLTESAVVKFQEYWHGHNPEIVVDGIIGPQTWDLRRFVEYLSTVPPSAPEPDPVPPPVLPYFNENQIETIMSVIENHILRKRKRNKIERDLRNL